MDTLQPPFKPHYLTVSDVPAAPRRSEEELGLDRPTSVPCLRISGIWLHQAGFTTGAKVRVEVSHGRLLIEPVPESPVSVPHSRRMAKPHSAHPRGSRAQLQQPER